MLVQATLLGFIFGEIWYFTQAIGSAFNAYINASNVSGIALVVWVITLVIVLLYAYFRNVLSDIQKLWRSNRADLFALAALVILGYLISAIVKGVGAIKYREYVGKVDVHQLLLLCAIPVVIALIFVLKAAIKQDRRAQSKSFFINDQAIVTFPRKIVFQG